MSVIAPGDKIEDLRNDLRRIEPPYLLRKYEATEGDYERLADEDLRCELLDGVLIVHSPATIQHEDRTAFLTTLLNYFVSQKGLGRVYASNAVMQLGERRFCADVSYLANGHFDRIRGGRVVGPMDLAVEIISKSTRSYDLDDKRKAYRDGKVPEIWFFDHEQKRCTIDMRQGTTYRSRTLIKGRFNSQVLQGLTLDVTWLWSEPLPNPLECLGFS